MKVCLSLRMLAISWDVAVVGFSDCFFTGEYMWLDLTNPASMHNYKYLEILILIIWSILTQKASRCLHEICHDSIAIYNLSIHQVVGE